ncbi:MAG: Eco57I restriction-modification methylase domain-containing protein [Marmoricola sp.]
MSAQAPFTLQGRNPDVLNCIANLSNDEVFTPPEFANRMLDSVAARWAASNAGADIWADASITFLDPFTKSGVFLREITLRLITGLKDEIPNLQERVDHILTKQVFGIATTRLTSLLARRTLYCSKTANGEYSIAKGFNDEAGNIWFERLEHEWVGGTEWVVTADERGDRVRRPTNGRCKYCGTPQQSLDRGADRESHAYAFIHTDNIKARVAELFGADMQFDVIIGNPPYQLDDGGFGTSAAPIYNKFVEQAKALDPRMLTMVIPARWFAGGKGLDEFREGMLGDRRVRSIDDFLNAADVFPGVGLKGGVCYFLWDRDNPGDCDVTTYLNDDEPSTVTRPLLEPGADVFIRFNEGLSILKKVVKVETGQCDKLTYPEGKRFEDLVSSRKPFGFDTSFKGKERKGPLDLSLYRNGGIGYVSRDAVRFGSHLIDSWKIFAGYAAPGTGNKDTYPHRIIPTPFLGEPGSVSSETYLAMGPFESKAQAASALSYLSCRLPRLLVLLHKPSQHVTKKVYSFVPTQTWDRTWTDAELYARYGITDEEVAFIEKLVRPMDLSGNDDG